MLAVPLPRASLLAVVSLWGGVVVGRVAGFGWGLGVALVACWVVVA